MAVPQIVYVRPGPAMLLSSLHLVCVIFIIGLSTRILPLLTVDLPAGALTLWLALCITQTVRETYSANDAWWPIAAAIGLCLLAALLTAPLNALPAASGFHVPASALHWWDFLAIGFGYLFGEACA